MGYVSSKLTLTFGSDLVANIHGTEHRDLINRLAWIKITFNVGRYLGSRNLVPTRETQ